MKSAPQTNPASSAMGNLRLGFVTGGVAVLAVVFAAMMATGVLSGPAVGIDESARTTTDDESYPAAPPPGSLVDTAPAPNVVVLAGIVLGEDERMRNFEAILRLHTWLGLRDLHTGQSTIAWGPATTAADAGPAIESDCDAGSDAARPAATLSSPAAVPATPARPRPTLLIRLTLQGESDRFRLEGFACRPGGRIHRQVIRDTADRLGRAQRELLTWLATQLEVVDTTGWEEDWGLDPAPAGPVRTGYARALRGSMGEEGVADASLNEVAQLLPEASWLAARLTNDPEERRLRLEQAVAMRIGFTAGLEDLAASHIAEDRADLAEATLLRLRRTAVGSRPVEWFLAWTLLRDDRPEDAARILRHLPEWLVATETSARLWSAILPAIGRPKHALRWVDAWATHDPQSGAAQLLRGEILATLDQAGPTAVAFAKAAELDPSLREEALEQWGMVQLEAGNDAEVAWRLADDELVEETPRLLEMRAFASSRAGDAAAAARDYEALTELEPDGVRHRLNRCVSALAAGQVPAEPNPCGSLPDARLSGNLLKAAALSRIPERTIPQFLELMDRAERAGREAPLDPLAADALLQVVGPFREKGERERMRGLWRLAVGSERRLTAADKPEEGTEPLSGSP